MTAFFWPVANVEQVYEGKLIYITKKNNYDFATGKIVIYAICRWSSYLQQILAVLTHTLSQDSYYFLFL